MIIRKLQETETMTETEREIAAYILDHKEEVIHMTAKELAEAAFASQSSVLRLCSRIDKKGFSDFKLRLSEEIMDNRKEKLEVNANQPFSGENSFDEIAKRIEELSTVSIRETRENLRAINLKVIIHRMKGCRMIDLYGMGGSQNAASDFKERLIRIGKDVHMEIDKSNQYYQALNSDPSHFAIIISHSGKTKEIVQIAKILKKQKTPILGITSEGENDLTPLVDYSIRTATTEKGLMMYKFDNIASQTAVRYVLDVLYSCIYREEYEENQKITRRNEEELKSMHLR